MLHQRFIMSMSRARCFMGIGSRVVRQLSHANRAAVLTVGGRWALKPTSTLTRSLWCLTHRPDSALAGWSDLCQRRAAHTEGDDAIAQFLEDEIKREKKIEKPLPSIKDFKLTKSGTSDVEFTKTGDGETIKVKFNINNTVSDMETSEERSGTEAVQMVSRPPFVVEITKYDKTFALSMIFPESGPADLNEGHDGEEAYEDEIIIDSVALMNKGEEWTDSVYTLQGMNMDGTMYDMLLDMLDERGITDKFLDELVDFATSYEQQHYIKFLEGLKNFCSK